MRWYYGWNVIAIAIAFQAILFGFTISSYTLWVNVWAESFRAPLTDFMIGITIFIMIQGGLAPFAGKAMDKFSIRLLVTIGVIGSAAGIALISLVTAPWQIVALYSTLIAFGTLLAGPLAAQTLAAKWFRGRRGFAIGISTVGTSLGATLMPPVVTKLFLEYGWRDTHLILAAAALLLVGPPVWWIIRNGPEEMGIEPDPESHISVARAATAAFPEWTTATILREPTFWIMVISLVPMATALTGVMHNLAPLAKDSGIDPLRASYLVSAAGGCAALGKIFFGLVTDRVDLRRLYWGANLTLFVAIWVFALQPAYPILLVASVLLGFAGGGFLPLLAAIISTRFGPGSFGRVMGLVGPFTVLTAFAPSAASHIRDLSGTFETALIALLAILVPAALVMVMLKPLAAIVPPKLAPGE
ncbi:MFS transporter [Emcibacter sp. SYSU 3D8]|uniref:MFS transporter n=1 Tax=Emcibacter sp. SYSU 3D8 TaxID=3133969 RepID=UPI0031FEF431